VGGRGLVCCSRHAAAEEKKETNNFYNFSSETCRRAVCALQQKTRRCRSLEVAMRYQHRIEQGCTAVLGHSSVNCRAVLCAAAGDSSVV
jgi:hypothetical protein